MTKKWCYLLALCIFLFSCKKKNANNDPGSVSYAYNLENNGKRLVYDLDQDTKYQFSSLFLFTDDQGKDFLTFKNSFSGRILFYDLESCDFLFNVNIAEEGPNGVVHPNGYYIEDFNNIYLTSSIPAIIKIDTSGAITQKINYESADNGYQIVPTFESSSLIYKPLIILGNKLYITQKPYFGSKISETPITVVIDTLSKSTEILPFYFPPILKDEELETHSTGVELAFSRDFNGEKFVYSFYFDEHIYVASIDHKQVEKILIKSKYIDKMEIEQRPDDIVQYAKRNNEIPFYGNLIYDKYRDVYYRMAYPRVELEDGLNYMKLAAQGRKKFSVIILDKDFNIIGETLFPEYIYNPAVVFINKDGLYICDNHVMNPNFDEDKLSFACFNLVEDK